jgi:hypothetical protein
VAIHLFWFSLISLLALFLGATFFSERKWRKETPPKCNCPSDTLRIFVLIGSCGTRSVAQTVLALYPINTSNTWQLQRGKKQQTSLLYFADAK